MVRPHRRLAIASAVVAAFASAGASSALASTDVEQYSLGISPGSVSSGAATPYTFSVQNAAQNADNLGTVKLTAPAGFTISAAALKSGETGHAAFTSSSVTLTSLALKPGATDTITVTASAPASCTTSSYTWASTVSESDGEKQTLSNPGSAQTTSVSTPCAVVFVPAGEPASGNVGQTISSSPDNPAGGPVQAEIVDGNGNVVTSSSAPITVALTGGAAGATLSGTLTQNAVNGVASFNNLSVNTLGYNLGLTASSAGLSSGNSSSFNEYSTGNATVCTENVNCTGTATDASTQGTQTSQSLSATATYDPNHPDAGLLFTQLDRGMSYFTGHSSQCGGYTPISADMDVVYMTASTRGKTLTDTVTTSLPNLTAFTLLLGSQSYCMAAPYPFVGASGAASATTLPDGTAGYIAQLATCTAQPSQPCISSSTGFLNGLLGTFTINVTIPAGEPGDPWGGH